MGKHTFKEWMIAVRAWSFPASAMPVIGKGLVLPGFGDAGNSQFRLCVLEIQERGRSCGRLRALAGNSCAGAYGAPACSRQHLERLVRLPQGSGCQGHLRSHLTHQRDVHSEGNHGHIHSNHLRRHHRRNSPDHRDRTAPAVDRSGRTGLQFP